VRAVALAVAAVLAAAPAAGSPAGTSGLRALEPWFRAQPIVRCFPFLAAGLFRTHERDDARNVTVPRVFLLAHHRVAPLLAALASLPQADDVYHYRGSNPQEDVILRMTRGSGRIAWYERAGVAGGQYYEQWIIGYMPLGSAAPVEVARSGAADAIAKSIAYRFAPVLDSVPPAYRMTRCGMIAVSVTDAVAQEQVLTLIFDGRRHLVAAVGVTSL